MKNQKTFTAFKLISLSHLLAFSPQLKQKKMWLNIAKKIIDSLSDSNLIDYASQAYFFGEFEAYLLYKAGKYFLKNKNFKKAETFFKKSLSSSLPLDLKKEVRQSLFFMKKISQINPYLIGVVIPLSGKRKALGEKILRGLYIGLFMNQSSPWQLLVLDSQNHPEVVRAHINDLFYKYHVVAVIGGLTGETAEVIAQKAEEFTLPAVILSQKKDITKNRPFVFQNAITAEQLLNPLIEELRTNLGIKKIAILYPNDFYGKDYSSLFSKIFTNKGGEITVKEMYKTGEVDFKNSIKQLLHLDIKNRKQEFEKLKAELLQKHNSSSRSLKLRPENVLPIQQDFSAVFIPDSLNRFSKIRDHFKYFGVTDIYFLGTNLWNNPDNKTKQKDFSFLFSDLPEKTNTIVRQSYFYKTFIQLYAYSPGHFEQKAYNTAVFFNHALGKKIKNRFNLQKKLKSIKNLKGAYYFLSISNDRVFQYPIKTYKFIAKKK